MKLTAVALGTVPPGDHSDDEGPGHVAKLFLRVRASGARSWTVRYSRGGRDVRFTLGKVKVKPNDEGLTLKAARDEALAVLARVAAGGDPQADKIAARAAAAQPGPATVTVADICREALAHLKLRASTAAEYARVVKAQIIPAFGPRAAGSVTRREIRTWLEGIAAGAPVGANRALAVFRRCWSLAIERDLIETTPFVGLKRPSKETPLERVLSAGELWALQRALDQLAGYQGGSSSADVVRLLLLTGVRLSNALGACAAEMHDLEGRDPRWIIPGERMKAGRPHVVPLSRQAVELVRRRLAGGSVYLFPGGAWRRGRSTTKAPSAGPRSWDGNFPARLRKRVNRFLGKLGPAAPWTIHGLRRTKATQMREALGVSRELVALMLSHQVPGGGSVTGIYDRAQLLPERRDAEQRWADWLDHLPAPGKVLAFKEADRG